MFERRVKILLAILIAFTVVLVARSLQVQVMQRGHWKDQAVRVMTRPELIETTRGRLLDRKGRILAEDAACIDACVDFRVITKTPDEKWVRDVALSRVRSRPGSAYREASKEQRARMLEEETGRVLTDIKIMWETLARQGNIPMDEIDEIRQSIVRKVKMRRRYVWYWKYKAALKEQENRPPSPWYQRWLIDETESAPELDQFDVTVAEQTEPHVILRAISNDTNNYLGKNRDRFPGLVLRASTHRVYPYQDAGAHLIGHLVRVAKEDVEKDPDAGNDLRRYYPNDLIGRTGLEALCEPLLRGTRGRIERYFGEESRVIDNRAAVPGADVATTIDIDFQSDLQHAFTNVILDRAEGRNAPLAMPGAAVVIDVASGQVLAMASYPSYDVNNFDEIYPQLVRDDVNRPLMNRATQFAMEPGSTVKPIVGLGAITQGLIGADGTIECTGYLQLGGRVYKTEGRCWVASTYHTILGGAVAHHPIPWSAPHPTGFLTFADALERSCNIYFETLADRLGIEGLAYWMDRFGLGRPTGIGIPEVAGRLPGDYPIPSERRRAAAWFSGIGQDQVLATPLQMANVAATIARNGVWVKPTLLPKGAWGRDHGSEPVPSLTPDRVDLKLSPSAIMAAREGMMRVANSEAGTGRLHRTDVLVAGKTGSAQAAALTIPKRDSTGRIILVPKDVETKDQTGKWITVQTMTPDRQTLQLGTAAQPNPLAPWYRGTGDKEDRRSHAWYMGFAPADNPRIAFAVMVEYGGGGGTSAGGVVNAMLDACIEHGYLARKQ